jgi:hypothetical protein
MKIKDLKEGNKFKFGPNGQTWKLLIKTNGTVFVKDEHNFAHLDPNLDVIKLDGRKK